MVTIEELLRKGKPLPEAGGEHGPPRFVPPIRPPPPRAAPPSPYTPGYEPRRDEEAAEESPYAPGYEPKRDEEAAEEFECPACGKGVDADSTSCPKCGAEFEGEEETEEPQEPSEKGPTPDLGPEKGGVPNTAAPPLAPPPPSPREETVLRQGPPPPVPLPSSGLESYVPPLPREPPQWPPASDAPAPAAPPRPQAPSSEGAQGRPGAPAPVGAPAKTAAAGNLEDLTGFVPTEVKPVKNIPGFTGFTFTYLRYDPNTMTARLKLVGAGKESVVTFTYDRKKGVFVSPEGRSNAWLDRYIKAYVLESSGSLLDGLGTLAQELTVREQDIANREKILRAYQALAGKHADGTPEGLERTLLAARETEDAFLRSKGELKDAQSDLLAANMKFRQFYDAMRQQALGLARDGKYASADRVLTTLLEASPTNKDIVGDIIRVREAAGSTGGVAAAKAYLARLDKP